jgi:flap endonuclease-1
MGIKGLTALIKEKAPDAIETSQLFKLSGKTIGIDASCVIYKCLMMIRSGGNELTNGKYSTSHIVGVFFKTCNYLSYGITPVYIFDGKPPEEKSMVIKQRNEKAFAAKSKLLDSNITNIEAEKLKKQTIRLRKYHVDDIKKLLDLMGVQWIDAEGEAEGVAAELCRIGLMDYVISEDMDTLAFGSPNLIRKCIDKTLKRKTDVVTIFHLDKVLEGFAMNYDEFLQLCILSGCDYCDTLKKVGNKTAFKLVTEYKTINKVLENVNSNKIPDGFISRYMRSQELFLLYRGYNDTRDIKIVKKPINYTGLIQYLVGENKMEEKKIMNAIQKINKSRFK